MTSIVMPEIVVKTKAKKKKNRTNLISEPAKCSKEGTV